jgi:hypothetical protein
MYKSNNISHCHNIMSFTHNLKAFVVWKIPPRPRHCHLHHPPPFPLLLLRITLYNGL